MSTIQSVLHEKRVFEPSAAWVAQATCPAWPLTKRCATRPRATTRASGRASRASTLELAQAVHARRSTRSNAPFYKWFEDGELNASYNCLDRNLEHGNGDKTAIIFEADDGTVTQGHLPASCYAARLPARQRAEGARHQEGRPRRHLHADVDRRRRRDAGVRAHRRHPLGGVRRLLGASRCRSASSTPARWP